jgi:hypothetical protein
LLDWANEATGQGAGGISLLCSEPLGVLAGNSCGVFFSDTVGTALLRPGAGFAAIVSNQSVQRAAVDDRNLYFYVNNSIGRLPLP